MRTRTKKGKGSKPNASLLLTGANVLIEQAQGFWLEQKYTTGLLRANFRDQPTAFSSDGNPLGHSTFWQTFKRLAGTLGANLAQLVQGGIKVASPRRT